MLKRHCWTMATWSRAVLCLTLLLATPDVIRSDQALPDITDQKFITDCVGEHNKHRSTVNPPASNMRYMTWDEGLAVTARAWARHCNFEHNYNLGRKGMVHPVFDSAGENLWAGTGAFSVDSAIQSWVNEVKFYNYDLRTCSKVCGHYTQDALRSDYDQICQTTLEKWLNTKVVWGNSYKVGCAVHFCPKGIRETTFFPRAASIFVCNYATPGNYRGQKPYISGSPCSSCGAEKCENKLCHNSTRDTLRRYNWTPSWDPALSECGPFCEAVLIARPVFLIIVFSSVYCIQHYYPNIFAYTS